MSETKRIKTALVSVYHKEGLDEIITKLHAKDGIFCCERCHVMLQKMASFAWAVRKIQMKDSNV